MIKRFLHSSIRYKMMILFSCIVIPLLALLIYTTTYSFRVLRQQVESGNQALLQLWMSQIDASFDEASKYYYYLGLYDVDFEIFMHDRQDDYHTIVKRNLWSEYQKRIGDFYFIDAMFLIDGEGIATLVDNQVVPAVEPQLRAYLETTVLGMGGGWHMGIANDDAYIVQIYQFLGVRVGFAASRTSICEKIMMGNPGISGALNIHTSGYGGRQKGEWVFRQESAGYPFQLMLSVPEFEILQSLPFIWSTIAIISVVIVVCTPVFLYWIRKTLLRPLGDIGEAIQQLEAGNLDYRIKPAPVSREFAGINNAFNAMTGQIRTLTIRNYEEQLARQKAKMRILELQVNPHFLLNCLNNIYQLAETRDCATIGKLARHMSNYFRSNLRREHEYVTLSQELKLVQEYLSIAKIRYQDHLSVACDLEDHVGQVRIPPLIVQTFVENITKHALVAGQTTTIHLSTRLEGDTVKIRIRDNGNGMDRTTLDKLLQGGRIVDEEGEHIGVSNARERIAQLPGGELHITSSAGKGTEVEIAFEITVDEEEDPDEAQLAYTRC